MRDYQRLDYQTFGASLLETFDLDPIYPMLVRANLSDDRLKRWLLAYWCYYSAGVASFVAEQPSKMFYAHMFAGLSDGWPRGHERRHFRGAAALASLEDLRAGGGAPEAVVDTMTCHDNFQVISHAVQSFKGFGPWISWKIADMTERVLQQPVCFDNTDMYMFKDPVKGAALVLRGDENAKLTQTELEYVVTKSKQWFGRYKAPPYLDRWINIQEVETILCKWKSHKHGHYPLGNDAHDIANGLQGWGDLAEHMYECLKQSVSYEV